MKDVRKFIIDMVWVTAILTIVGLALIGCTTQRPVQQTITNNYYDQSQHIENSTIADSKITPTARVDTTQEITPEQTTSEKKSDGSLLRAILGIVLIGAGALFVWFKWIRKKV
jgi:hypothetical protein